MFKSIKFSLLATIVAIFVIPNLAFAQQAGDVAPQVGSQCISLQKNMALRSKDSFTNGEVSDLQGFLQDQGLLTIDPTGYFGALTFKAVKTFQLQKGLLNSGYVGVMTRQAIKDLTCSVTEIATTRPGAGGTGTVTTGVSATPLPVGCTSTSRYSTLTGQSCFPTTTNVTYPAGCISNSGFSPLTGESCGGSGIGTTTPNSNVSFAITSGFTDQVVSPNTAGVKIGSFTVQAGPNDDMILNALDISPVTSGYYLSYNITNLTLKTGDMILGTPVGIVSSNKTFEFTSSPITVLANTSKTFDVYADIGSASQGDITTSATIYYRGNDWVSKELSAKGIKVTSANSGLANPVLSPSSPVSQFVVGGTSFGIATYKVSTASAGTNATITEMFFDAYGTDAIESITVGGVTKAVPGFGATTITGLNIPVGSTGTDIPVIVQFSSFQPGKEGGLTAGVSPVKLILNHITARLGSGSSIYNNTSVSSNPMTLVASKPTVTMASGAGSSPLVLGAENKIGEFTVTADANGKIALNSVEISLTSSGITNLSYSDNPGLSYGTNIRIANGNTTINGVSIGFPAGSTNNNNKRSIKFSNPYEIAAGQSTTFSVYATINGTQTSNASIPSISSKLNSESFLWNDVIGGNIQYTGVNIYNFPTNLYSTNGGNVTPVSVPIVSISASPSSVNQGQSSNISWQATGATSCYANSVNGGDLDWMGNTLANGKPSGVVTVTPRVTSTYEILCSGNGKSVKGTATVNVTPVVAQTVPAPSVSLFAFPSSITSGQSTTVTWSSSNVNYCTLTTGSIDDYGPGSAPLSGSKVVGPLTSTSTVSLACPGKNGTTAYQSLIIPVTPIAPIVSAPVVPAPSVSLFAFPSSITSGQSTTVTWSSSNVNYCTLTTGSIDDYGPGSAPLSGSKVVGPLTSTSTVSLACPGKNGTTAYQSLIIPVTPIAPIVLTPKITSLAMLSGMLKVGDTADINFSSENTNYCHLYMTPPNSAEITLTEGYFSSKLVTTSPLTASGSYRVVIYCWDKTGAAANQSTTFNVSPSAVLGDFASNASCINLPRNLHRGAESSFVTKLQSFFVEKGLLTDTPTGFYGDKTVSAVKDYQAMKGLPQTGMVYDFTRAAIKADSCK